ncbi:putative asparagine synthase (glutamine-hydrolyzing) [Helianthus anomalus]
MCLTSSITHSLDTLDQISPIILSILLFLSGTGYFSKYGSHLLFHIMLFSSCCRPKQLEVNQSILGEDEDVTLIYEEPPTQQRTRSRPKHEAEITGSLRLFVQHSSVASIAARHLSGTKAAKLWGAQLHSFSVGLEVILCLEP